MKKNTFIVSLIISSILPFNVAFAYDFSPWSFNHLSFFQSVRDISNWLYEYTARERREEFTTYFDSALQNPPRQTDTNSYIRAARTTFTQPQQPQQVIVPVYVPAQQPQQGHIKDLIGNNNYSTPTTDQRCKAKFGSHSYFGGRHNAEGTPACDCEAGYKIQNGTCAPVPTPVTPARTAPSGCDDNGCWFSGGSVSL